jgi:hypothetical protein
MTRSTIPLQDLAQRINQQQAELTQLRQEYEARQTQLQKLTRRKEELQTQLRQVETEIQRLGYGSQPPKSKPAAGSAAKPAPPKPGTKPSGHVTLAQLLVEIVAQAGRPLPIQQLVAEVVRRKYVTTSQNLPALVAERVKGLVKKGVLRRAPNRQGVLPGPAKAPVAQSASGAGTLPKPSVVAGVASTPPPAVSASGLTLAALVTKILAGSPEPVTAGQLADQVLASGYQTTSKDFKKLMSVAIWKMDNVEQVPGKGYRLKKGKTAAPASAGKGSR